MFKRSRQTLSHYAQRRYDQGVALRAQAAKARISARSKEEHIIIPSFSTMILLHLENILIRAIATIQAGVVSDFVVFALIPVQGVFRFLLMLVLLGLDSVSSVMRVDEEMQRITACYRFYQECNHNPVSTEQARYTPIELLDTSAPSSPVPNAHPQINAPKTHSVSAAVQTIVSHPANPAERVNIQPSRSESVSKTRSKLPVRVRITSSPSSLMTCPDSPNLQLRRIHGQRDLLDSSSRGASAPTSPQFEFASYGRHKRDMSSSSMTTSPVHHHKSHGSSLSGTSRSGSSFSQHEAKHDELFPSSTFSQSIRHGEGATLPRASSSGSSSGNSKKCVPAAPVKRICNMNGYQPKEPRQLKTPMVKAARKDVIIPKRS